MMKRKIIMSLLDYILPLENLEDIQFIETNKDKLESIDIKRNFV